MNKPCRRTLNILLYLLVIAFLGYYLRSVDIVELKKLKIVSPGYLFLAVGFAFLSRVFLPFVWTSLLYAFTDKRLDNINLYRIYARSWICRYIPGKVAWIGTKITQSVETGFSKTNAVISSFLEVIIHLLGSMVIGLLFCGIFYNFSEQMRPLLYGAAGLGLLILLGLSPMFFNRMTRVAYLVYKKETLPGKYTLSWNVLSKSTGLCLVIKIFSGAIVGCLAFGLGGALGTPYIFFSLIGIASLSSVAGMVAFFAPGGLVVNESVQLVLLAGIMSKEEALIIVTSWRLLGICADLVFWMVFDLIVPRCFCLSRKNC